jgi:diaminohydroxyphosphoribosylaminopyrimidine deaminase / 5-amino-6-(5-phosphoribosylamino)uracil reductase
MINPAIVYLEKMMGRALTLARKGIGKTAPNPPVGCVIVNNGEIIGTGWHRKAGTPHAEVHALREAGERARGADVFVTLEPCSHFGKTPPCADALIAAGVGRVYAGMIDPNPLVAGQGIEKLRAAGIPTFPGLMEQECRRLIGPFLRQTTTGLPLVTVKSALTLDGKTATASGDSKWITGEAARRHVHRLRAEHDALMVGAGTVLADDPELTCRLPRGGRDPLRVILDSRLRLSPEARIFHLRSTASTLIATLEQDGARMAAYRERGVELITCRGSGGRIELADLLTRLGERGVQSVLVESGGELAGELLRQGLIDRLILFYGAKLVGGEGRSPFAGCGVEKMSQAIRLQEIEVRRFGEDLMVSGYLR